MVAVRGIFARENGEGMFFQNAPVAAPSTEQTACEPSSNGNGSAKIPPSPDSPVPGGTNGRKSHLQIVK
jgi:stringent starvation protein B